RGVRRIRKAHAEGDEDRADRDPSRAALGGQAGRAAGGGRGRAHRARRAARRVPGRARRARPRDDDRRARALAREIGRASWRERGDVCSSDVEAFEEYAKRMPRGMKTELIEIRPEPRSEGKPAGRLVAAEAERIERAVPRGAFRVALDERGREMTTDELARWLERSEERRGGRGETCALPMSRRSKNTQSACRGG